MTPLKLTPPVVAAAADAYRRGEGVRSIADRLGVDWSNLYKAFRRAGVGRDQCFTYLTDDQRAEVARQYRAGDSQGAIATRLGVDRGTVRYALQKGGVELRSQGESCRVRSLDQHAFDEVTEGSAYWAGFLMADGYIRVRKGRPWGVRLSLSSKDRGHLDKFRAFVGSSHQYVEGPPYLTKRTGWQRPVHFSFTSEHMAARLAEFGVVNRKTETATVRLLESDRHFWRGLIDGDGTVRWTKTPGGPRPELRACGSRPMMKQFRQFCLGIVPDTVASVRHGVGVWLFTLGHLKAAAVIREMYAGCSVALDRKLAVANEVIRAYPL